MFAHAIDSSPNYQIALADNTSMTMVADAGTPHLMPAVGASVPPGSDWKVAEIAGASGLCFVRRGAGGWNGVITVCDGRVESLSQVQRRSLEPAAFHPSASAELTSAASWIDNSRRTSLTTDASQAWQRGMSYLLLAIGLGLAVKSGSMLLHGSRKYG